MKKTNAPKLRPPSPLDSANWVSESTVGAEKGLANAAGKKGKQSAVKSSP